MITTILELPEAWGWYGKSDQTAYAVYVGKEHWATYCYLGMAMSTAERLEAEYKTRPPESSSAETPR